MAEVKAFKALRFTERAGDAAELVCPPYDIISEDERREYLSKNSRNIIRLELPRDGVDPYKKAGEELESWMNDGILARGERDAFYIYEEEYEIRGESRRLKGIIGRVRLEPFEKGVVLPHEETLSKAKTDRFNLMIATACNFSSIYSLYFDRDREISARIEAVSGGLPDMEFTAAADGITHRVWTVTDEYEINALSLAFRDKKLYIADGHHRYETALNYQKSVRGNYPLAGGEHPADYVMMTLVDIGNAGLTVLPTHRVVKGLKSFDPEKLAEACGKYFDIVDCGGGDVIKKLEEARDKNQKALALRHKGRTSILTLRDISIMNEMLPDASEAYRGLDVTVLHTLILERLLGIDKENMANQKNLAYTRDMHEAFALADSGEADCAFILNPTRVEEIAAVAGANEKMPQKSTYFYPKLITGHVMNMLKV